MKAILVALALLTTPACAQENTKQSGETAVKESPIRCSGRGRNNGVACTRRQLAYLWEQGDLVRYCSFRRTVIERYDVVFAERLEPAEASSSTCNGIG